MIKPSSSSLNPGLILFPPALATSLCWYLSPNDITPLQGVLTYLLLLIPWAFFHRWKIAKTRDFPLFALLGAMHWVYFAQPVFFGDRRIPGFAVMASEELITKTVLMALIGVVFLGFGMFTRISPFEPSRLPDLTDNPMSWPYMRVVMTFGILMALKGANPYAFGDGGRQILMILRSAAPSTIFAFFFRKYVIGTAARIDRILVYLFLGSIVLVSLSSGWLGTLVWPGVICALIYITEGRRIPVMTSAVVLASILFLQVGKEAFRDVYWEHQAEGSVTERVGYWIEQSASRWSDAIEGKGTETSGHLASETVGRLSLLTQAAHVLDWTPEIVPFQHGKTYSYLLVTFIPRFVWPDKPSVSEANQFYQVAYGLTRETELNKVSIAVGFLTEGYINFGWLGVIAATYCVGLVLGIFQRTFLAAESTTLFRCIGLAAIPGLMTLESQMAQYLGGLIQQTALIFLILLPIIKPRARRAMDSVRTLRQPSPALSNS